MLTHLHCEVKEWEYVAKGLSAHMQQQQQMQAVAQTQSTVSPLAFAHRLPDGKAEDCPDTREMTFRQYASWWRDHTGKRDREGCSGAGSLAWPLVSDPSLPLPLSPPLLYMKDFHLNSACPHYKVSQCDGASWDKLKR